MYQHLFSMDVESIIGKLFQQPLNPFHEVIPSREELGEKRS